MCDDSHSCTSAGGAGRKPRRALFCLTAAVGFLCMGAVFSALARPRNAEFAAKFAQVERGALQPLVVIVTDKRVHHNTASRIGNTPRFVLQLTAGKEPPVARVVAGGVWQALQPGDTFPAPAYVVDGKLFIPELDALPDDDDIFAYVALLSGPLLLLTLLFHRLDRRQFGR